MNFNITKISLLPNLRTGVGLRFDLIYGDNDYTIRANGCMAMRLHTGALAVSGPKFKAPKFRNFFKCAEISDPLAELIAAAIEGSDWGPKITYTLEKKSEDALEDSSELAGETPTPAGEPA